MEKNEVSIFKIEESIRDFFNQRDLMAVMEYFDENFIGFSSTTYDRITDLSALQKTFEYYLQEGDSVKYDVSQIQVRMYGDSALSTFYWDVRIMRLKKARKISGRGSHLFLNRNGNWKIVHEHYSKTH